MTPKQLKGLRRRLGLTQAQFADKVGVAPNTVARWERAELGMRPTIAKLIKLLAQEIDLTAKSRKER